MKKRGFTIIELLATLTILLLVAAILIPTLFNMSDDVKSKQYTSQKELILSAAREYGEDNINSLLSECTNITIQTLINGGYLKADSDSASDPKTVIKDPRNNEILNDKIICITYREQATVSVSSGNKTYYKVQASFVTDY